MQYWILDNVSMQVPTARSTTAFLHYALTFHAHSGSLSPQALPLATVASLLPASWNPAAPSLKMSAKHRWWADVVCSYEPMLCATILNFSWVAMQLAMGDLPSETERKLYIIYIHLCFKTFLVCMCFCRLTYSQKSNLKSAGGGKCLQIHGFQYVICIPHVLLLFPHGIGCAGQDFLVSTFWVFGCAEILAQECSWWHRF